MIYPRLCDAFAREEDSDNTNKNSAANFSVILFTNIWEGNFHHKKKIVLSNQAGKTGLVVKSRGQLANSLSKTMSIL